MDYFTIFVARFVLLFFGLAGNSIGLAVFYRPHMARLSTKKLYRTMLFMDSFFLCTQIFEDSALSLGLDLRTLSTVSCKVRYYWNYSIGPISPWLLVFITVERYIAIQHKQITILKQKNFQKLVIILILIYNLSIYSPMAILKKVFSVPSNETDDGFYFYCDFDEPVQSTIMSTLDLINSALLPFLIMFTFSVSIIHSIYMKRLGFASMRSHDRKKLEKDMRFGFSSIMLNITFVLLNLPLCLANIFFTNISDFLYNVFIVLFYANFCINFYVLALFNSIFRNELLVMFRLRKEKLRRTKHHHHRQAVATADNRDHRDNARQTTGYLYYTPKLFVQ